MGQSFCIEARRFDGDLSFPLLPFDIGLKILEYLDASSLCTLALVNSDFFRLANLDHLWKKLCHRKVHSLRPNVAADLKLSWKQVHKIIQMFIFMFNTDAEQGSNMFLELGLIENDPFSLALFLSRTTGLSKMQIGRYISAPSRIRVLEEFVRIFDCRGMLLAEALKRFLTTFEIAKEAANARIPILEAFAGHYVQSNPSVKFTRETIFLLCFSLILLGTDLSSPHVKNKMSKREFIRNNKRIIGWEMITDDYLGELYDFVFLQGLFPIKEEPRRCNAVLNQLTLDNHHRWQLFPRVLPLNHALAQ